MDTYTVCFCGTACTRDEGEISRPQSDARIYCPETGYIPVRIHLEISGDLTSTSPSVTVRGVGENDWSRPRNCSEELRLDGPLRAPKDLLDDVRRFSGGNQFSKYQQIRGCSDAALALHGANLAAASGAQAYNFIGHSRGAAESVMAAWFLYAYGRPDVPIRIFAIDPVPGMGNWYSILTQLPPNVREYVGIYAWDHLDVGFNAVVPRPNGPMTGGSADVTVGGAWPWNGWQNLADRCQLDDPLASGRELAQPQRYTLYACRGKHSTVSGNATADGLYDAENVDASVAPLPQLVYKTARAYLSQWGTTFKTDSAVEPSALELRRRIHTDPARFDAMGGGATRTSIRPNRPYVRRVSSICGRNPLNTYYFEDVVGDPPYRLAYPVTKDRKNAGWVRWNFL